MTLGQRIQELRRGKNLSQEALGGILNVSRQAISKWESDSTVPDVDKLVAMSRFFAVPVGVLLGVEEVLPEQDTGLTERELQVVEAVAGRYLEAVEEKRADMPGPPPRKKWPWVLGGAAVLLLGLILTLFGAVRQLEKRISGIQDQMGAIRGDVADEISAIGGKVEEALGRQADLLAGSGWSCTGTDPAAGTAELVVEVIPKRYTEGMGAIFQARDGTSLLSTIQAEMDSGTMSFRAEGWSVPLTDQVELWVVFEGGGESRTQYVETIYSLVSDSELKIRTGWPGGYPLLEISIEEGLGGIVPTEVEIQLRKNQEIQRRIAVDLDAEVLERWTYYMSAADMPRQQRTEDGYYIFLKEELDQGYVPVIYAKDSAGREYTAYVSG